MALDDGLLYLALAAIGATTGVLTGLTGASGMSLLISGLLLLGVEIRDIIGLTFVVTLVNSAVALGPYWRHGRVDLRTALWVAIPAMLAVVAGHFVARRVTSGALTNGITAALFCVGWRFLLAPAEPPHAAPSAPARPPAWPGGPAAYWDRSSGPF